MKSSIFASALLAATLLSGCANAITDSEREWRRGQCAQIIDKEAREKCMERVPF